MKMTISVCRCLKSKVIKEYINKNFGTCKSLCNLQNLSYILLSKKNAQKEILDSQGSVHWDPSGVLAGSKITHSVYICSTHQYRYTCICIYIYKVRYIPSFFVIFNCSVFSALHAKHFEIWKNILWNWWVDCFIARSIKRCDISGCS